MIPAYDDEKPIELLGALIDTGHADMAKAISLVWGEPECPGILLKYMVPDQFQGGLPDEAFKALMDLQELHRGLFGPKVRDVWEDM